MLSWYLTNKIGILVYKTLFTGYIIEGGNDVGYQWPGNVGRSNRMTEVAGTLMCRECTAPFDENINDVLWVGRQAIAFYKFSPDAARIIVEFDIDDGYVWLWVEGSDVIATNLVANQMRGAVAMWIRSL